MPPRATAEILFTWFLVWLMVFILMLPILLVYSGPRLPEIRFLAAAGTWCIGVAPFALGLVWAVRSLALRPILASLVLLASAGMLVSLAFLFSSLSGGVYPWMFAVHGGISGACLSAAAALSVAGRRLERPKRTMTHALAVLLAGQLVCHALEFWRLTACTRYYLYGNDECPRLTIFVPVLGGLAILLAVSLVALRRREISSLTGVDAAPHHDVAEEEAMSCTSPEGQTEQQARIGSAVVLLLLAYIFSFHVVPVFLGHRWHPFASPRSAATWGAALVFLVSCVMVSLLEGVRGLRQRRSGAILAVTFSVLWFLFFFLLLLDRAAGGR